MRMLLLALPLASLVILAGCRGDECYTCSANIAAAPAVSTVDAKVAAADLATTETKTVVAVGKVEAKQPVKTVQAVASSQTIPTIRAEKLPKGWSYMGEAELSGGELNRIPVDQMYTQMTSEKSEG